MSGSSKRSIICCWWLRRYWMQHALGKFYKTRNIVSICHIEIQFFLRVCQCYIHWVEKTCLRMDGLALVLGEIPQQFVQIWKNLGTKNLLINKGTILPESHFHTRLLWDFVWFEDVGFWQDIHRDFKPQVSLLISFCTDLVIENQPNAMAEYTPLGKALSAKKKKKNKKINKWINKYSIDIFLIFPQKTCHGYSMEAPCWGISSEYPQRVFFWEIRKLFIWKLPS